MKNGRLNDFGAACMILCVSALLYGITQFVVIPYNSSLLQKTESLSAITASLRSDNTRRRSELLSMIEELGMEVEITADSSQ
ncbi:MAG: hypothetical protein ACI32N_01835 [Bulleidia sp.]